LTVVAGPNGSGKSTLTRIQLASREIPLLDPDAVARTLNPDAPQLAAVAAGRVVIERRNEYLRDAVSFVLETTLAGATTLHHMELARKAGFTVDLIYVCIENVEGNIMRVAHRAMHGGHSVPEADIRRRYERSLENLPSALALADHALIFDNSEITGHRLLFEFAAQRVMYRSPELLRWVQQSIGHLF
jgi:predicted ABC-type ATPase